MALVFVCDGTSIVVVFIVVVFVNLIFLERGNVMDIGERILLDCPFSACAGKLKSESLFDIAKAESAEYLESAQEGLNPPTIEQEIEAGMTEHDGEWFKNGLGHLKVTSHMSTIAAFGMLMGLWWLSFPSSQWAEIVM